MSTDGGRFPFYAVRRGRVPGVYRSWQECEQQVNGYRNSEHRGFRNLAEAVAWLRSAAASPARQPTPPVQTINPKDDNVLFGFTVVLPHNGRGLDLVAHGPLCYSEHFARQEVSFTMLDKILSTMGYTIRDYNHHIVVRVTAQLNQEKKEEVDRLNNRIRKLELENEELRGQVEMFGEMLEE
ncbi:hypothetical protein Ahy_A03g011075 [Arachis hypogaea]|uniref:Ribonuclease H n=1 Tax=Arachis hypogaea TaxID=3818 RepID=A0A445DPI9_ARAHY|nr:hypothetical protein Ahy_A03g011075 [Arachis hypogaea]